MIYILKLSFFIYFLLLQNLSANKISIDVTGLARVGEACFLSIMLKNKSNHKINKLGLSFFATSLEKKVLGDTFAYLNSLNKQQPYLTSIRLNLVESSLCKDVKNLDIYLDDCEKINNGEEKSCDYNLEIEQKGKSSKNLNLKVLKNKYYYTFQDNLFYTIPEIKIVVSPLNQKLARKYSIKNYRKGFVVVKNFNKIFNEGDLIFEIEMKNINNIKEIQDVIRKIILEKRNSILVNFVRQNEEKLVAVSIK